MPNGDREAVAVVEKFIAAINARDVAGMGRLMTDDHKFVDATGVVHPGRENMMSGWEGYFASFPEYRIEVEKVVADGDVVAVFGWAGGRSGAEPGEGRAQSWRVPVAWKAILREGSVAEWQVFCDVEPMLRSMAFDRWSGGAA